MLAETLNQEERWEGREEMMVMLNEWIECETDRPGTRHDIGRLPSDKKRRGGEEFRRDSQRLGDNRFP